MKSVSIPLKITTACLVFCLLAAGAWIAQQENTGLTADSSLESLAGALAAKGATGGATAALGAEEARKELQSESEWVASGDALMQKARETADGAYYGHAERAYRKALALNPKTAAAAAGMAWVCGCRHEFEKSAEWARNAVAMDPRNQAAYGLLGDAAVETGNYEAAFDYYQKMLDIRPDISSYSRGAHLLLLTGDIRKAAWLMAKAVEAGSPHAENTVWCRAQLALMLFNNGNLRAAEQTLKAALQRTPDNYNALSAMGRVQAGKKDYPSAIAYYRKAVATAPQIESMAALGDLYALTGKKRDAEEQYATVEAIHRLNRANGMKGDLQIARFYADHDRNLPEALALAEKEYRVRKNVYAADTLAWCYFKNGRYAEAREMIRKALSKGTPEPVFLFHAGMIHAKLGDRSAAQQSLYKALSLNPNFSPVFASRATDLLKELGLRPPSPKQANSG
ncbi:MAG: tetratricopeptide repeat protein [Armatimonadetes bacterium]|nr:tetratricopeptide repeat protein [Armatimonadota bacterium]